MATFLYKPVIYSIPAFDAKKGYIVTFSYSGGSIFENTILIKENTTNEEVYRKTISTRQLKHEIPPDILTNGNVYNVSIQVGDSEGNYSEFSDSVLIYCFTTPEFKFLNIENEQIISSSFIELQLYYNQIENELLDQYDIILYDGNMVEILNSGNLYDTNNMKYTISNLVNGNFYYVQAIGRTVHNMTISTDTIYFNIRYINQPVFTLLGLENKPDIGAISISPNLISIEGSSNPDPPKYIENDMVDLTEDGSYVKFDKGFNIYKNFTIQIIGKNFKDFSEILYMGTKNYNISVKYKKGTFDGYNEEVAYIELKANNAITSYVQMSNYISLPLNEEYVYIWIRHINGVFELKLEIYNGGV